MQAAYGQAAINVLKILLAWEEGELSEGQVVEALQMPRVEVRALRDDALDDAKVIYQKLRAAALAGRALVGEEVGKQREKGKP